MRRILLAGLAAGLALSLAGCSWFGKSQAQQRLETGSSGPTTIPEELDTPPFHDSMPVPELADYRGLTDRGVELRPPAPLSATFGVDQIVIRRLGEARWVFLDLPVATIWPRLVLFWEENGIPVERLDPRRGVLETAWVPGVVGSPEEIYNSLVVGGLAAGGFAAGAGGLIVDAEGLPAGAGGAPVAADGLPESESAAGLPAGAAAEPSLAYRFRARIEPGVRNGSTELYIEEQSRPLDAEDAAPRPWDGVSDNPELEGRMLSAVAYYFGDRITQGPSVSLLAAGLQESKAALAVEAGGMVLRYRLDFNRAWATVGAALETAGVLIEDLDRSGAVYYVHHISRAESRRGIFSRLFRRGRDDDSGEEPGHHFLVKLQDEGREVLVTVNLADAAAETDTDSLILEERLLKLIREFST